MEGRELLEPHKSLQDGRLHDVSIDGGDELPELEPGMELGGATLGGNGTFSKGGGLGVEHAEFLSVQGHRA